MTNILMTTHGTSGDVVPLLSVGQALSARGHSVTLITHSHYADLARQAGMDFIALDQPAEFEAYMEDTSLLHTPSGQIDFFKRQNLPKARLEYHYIRERHQPGETLIISSHLFGLGGQLAAEKLNLPLVRIFIAVANLARLELLEKTCANFLAADINRVRAELELTPVHDWHAWLRMPNQNIGSWPEWFAPPEPGWPAELAPVGFLTFDTGETGTLPEAFQEFLTHGEPPILITGGTGRYIRSDFFSASIQACLRLGRRAILVTRYPQQVPHPLPDQVQWFPALPFATLMPHVALVIHHGGTSTLARAMAAGIPQLALAAGADRVDTAQRLQRLGVAEYLPPAQWQPERIAEALKRLLESVGVQARCQEFARRLQNSNPALQACQVVEELLTRHSTPHLKPTRPVYSANLDSSSPPLPTEALRPADKHWNSLSPERQALLALRLKKHQRNSRKAS